MKIIGLTPYILVSFLIHAGVLIGVHRFLKLPAEEPDAAKLIPVEIVVVKEESAAFEPGFAPGNRIWPIKALQAKSKIIIESATDRSAHEMAGPVPKTIGFEPHVTNADSATTGFSIETRAGENADSKPITLVSKIIPPQVSPTYPLAPEASARLAVKIPKFLIEAQTELSGADFGTPEKVALPLPGKQTAVEPVLKMPPLATERLDDPRLALDTKPMLREVSREPEAETAAGYPMILTVRMSPLQLAPADPSPPPMSSPFDVKLPGGPVEAPAAAIPEYPLASQKIETPLAGRRRRENPPDAHPPMPTKGSNEPALMVSTLQFTSHPIGAQVFVDGMLSGETPLDMELPVGKHEVRLALPDYYDWKAQIELTERSKTLPIFFRLLPVE